MCWYERGDNPEDGIVEDHIDSLELHDVSLFVCITRCSSCSGIFALSDTQSSSVRDSITWNLLSRLLRILETILSYRCQRLLSSGLQRCKANSSLRPATVSIEPGNGTENYNGLTYVFPSSVITSICLVHLVLHAIAIGCENKSIAISITSFDGQRYDILRASTTPVRG